MKKRGLEVFLCYNCKNKESQMVTFKLRLMNVNYVINQHVTRKKYCATDRI